MKLTSEELAEEADHIVYCTAVAVEVEHAHQAPGRFGGGRGAGAHLILGERAHSHGSDDGEHLLDDRIADAGVAGDVLGEGSANVLGAEQVAEDAVAILDGFGQANRGGVIDILGVVAAVERAEETFEAAGLADVVLHAAGEGGQELTEDALGLLSAEAELFGKGAHVLAAVALHQNFEEIHARKNIMVSKLTMQVLLVDDDVELTSLMQDFLRDNGFEFDVAHDGTQGLAKALNGGSDLVILDGMLPGIDGLEVLRQIRKRSNVPVIMLTARGAPSDRIAGLDTGADDYLTKPFGPDELVARIRAIMRRTTMAAPAKSEALAIGALRVDAANREVALAEVAVSVTGAQFDILEYLMRHAGRAVSRDELTSILHQRESTPFERWLDVHVSQLRKKVESDGVERILTVRGVGYMFKA